MPPLDHHLRRYFLLPEHFDQSAGARLPRTWRLSYPQTAVAASARFHCRICALAECTPLWRNKIAGAGAIADEARVEAVLAVIDRRDVLETRAPAPHRCPPLQHCGG